jgi:hypothetical protein
LVKLIEVTKVPVILTLSDPEVRRKIVGYLEDLGVTFETARYRYTKMDDKTAINALWTIHLFETQLATLIGNQSFE